MFNNPASTVFTNEDTLLGNTVKAACDALEGVVDGVLNEPRRCAFNPDRHLGKGSQKPPNCLTAKQVEAVRNIWTGTDQMVQQHNYYPPFERGGAADGWPFSISPQPPPGAANRPSRGDWHSLLRVLRLRTIQTGIIERSTGSPTQLTWTISCRSGSDVGVGFELDQPRPDAFPGAGRQAHPVPRVQRSRGAARNQHSLLRERREISRRFTTVDSGVLPVVHGAWDEPLLGWSRPNVFDMFTPLVQWVEDDIALERVIVTHYVNNNPAQGVQFTRPLCPYPKEAEYKGGNTDDAANFVCKNRTSEIGSSPVSCKMKA